MLSEAVRYLKPGGRLLYVTCSVLREENEERVEALLARTADLAPIEAAHLASKAGVAALGTRGSTLGPGLRLTPLTAGTDGFYVAGLTRIAG